MTKNIKIEQVAYHRNGVSGEGFYLVLFRYDGRNMMATVFPRYEEDGETFKQAFHNVRIAVVDRDLLAAGDIGMGSNSWRGDRFTKPLYEACRRHSEADWDRKAEVDYSNVGVAG